MSTIPPVPSGPPDAAIVAELRAAGCVFAEDEALLLLAEARGADDLARRLDIRRMLDLRIAGTPLEQVLGWAEFAGLRLHVEPGVFVPRRRSELLVAEALSRIRPGSVVVDLCCGTGALGAALADRMPGIELHASDLDDVAVRCARRNLDGVGTVWAGDLYDALPVSLRGRVDLLVVNAPYVPTSDIGLMPTEARDHEHPVALDGGSDGLAIQRRVAGDARSWLAPHAHLVIETSERQAPVTAELFEAAGLTTAVVRDDDIDATVVVARA